MPGAKLHQDAPNGICTRWVTPATCIVNTTTAMVAGPLDQNIANRMDIAVPASSIASFGDFINIYLLCVYLKNIICLQIALHFPNKNAF